MPREWMDLDEGQLSLPSALRSVVLPVELWLLAMRYLPRESLQSCLQVCREWHDVAVTLLFFTTRIYFGSSWYELHTEHSELGQRELEERLAYKSSEILDCVMTTPSFARAIKCLIVCASGDEPLVFEKRSLSKALAFLPHLLFFEWRATIPPFPKGYFPERILQDLAESCPLLRHIGIPSVPAEPGSSLHFSQKLDSVVAYASHDSQVDNSAFDFLNNAIPNATIRDLQLRNCSMINAPLRVFIHLRQLALCKPQDLDGLLLPFHHMHSLESLSLQSVTDLTALRSLLSGTTELKLVTRLSSFFLSSSENFHEPDFTSIRDFLSDRSTLRRLCLDFDCDWADMSILLPAIRNLTHLEAVGLTLVNRFHQIPDQHDVIDTTEVEVILDALPSSLQAFVFDVEYYAYYQLVRRLSEFPSLTFLYLPNELASLGMGESYATQMLAMELPHLTLVGCWNDIANVERQPADIADIRLRRWSGVKKDSKHKDDFDNPNAYWLMNNLLVE
ncbi:hypothetical protein HYDPIDRAFT_27170 [Hydnomerulius pinastri MD-312]|nr:hypothetical protein HYDPIDRAFT_27170 [Hydnomerulius pinastri MD-312]